MKWLRGALGRTWPAQNMAGALLLVSCPCPLAGIIMVTAMTSSSKCLQPFTWELSLLWASAHPLTDGQLSNARGHSVLVSSPQPMTVSAGGQYHSSLAAQARNWEGRSMQFPTGSEPTSCPQWSSNQGDTLTVPSLPSLLPHSPTASCRPLPNGPLHSNLTLDPG